MLNPSHRKSTAPGAKATRDPVKTRDAILEAAFAEIYRAGFRGSDVETILANAGVTKGALYHHFENKDALGYAVVDEVIGGLMRTKWLDPLDATHDPIDALIAIFSATPLTPRVIANGCPLNNISQEMAPLDEGFRRRTQKLFDIWVDAVAQALSRGQERGLVATSFDAREAAIFILASYEGYTSLAKSSHDADTIRIGQKMLVGYLNSLRAARG